MSTSKYLNGNGLSEVWTNTKNYIAAQLLGKSDVGHTHTKSEITDFPSLATVATSGSYNDLSNTPTIPAVNNATLTIQQNGTTVDTFTANSSSDKTANIQCVDLNNNQTVGGIKTFSNAPVVNSINLDGKTIDTNANGDMTYDSHIVDTIEEQGDGYIRYSNGIQICSGSGLTYRDGSTSNQIVAFPKPFSSGSVVSLICQSTNPYVNGILYGFVTNQDFTVSSKGHYTFCYIAIGKWK